jgi:hypothetical protein
MMRKRFPAPEFFARPTFAQARLGRKWACVREAIMDLVDCGNAAAGPQ